VKKCRANKTKCLIEKLPKRKKFLNQTKNPARKPILKKSVVLYANGRLENQVFGFAPIAMHPNFSTAAAARVGTHLKLAGNVRRALINGFGHRVCFAVNGRATKIGMKKSPSDFLLRQAGFLDFVKFSL
jgi:hypothetical protein